VEHKRDVVILLGFDYPPGARLQHHRAPSGKVLSGGGLETPCSGPSASSAPRATSKRAVTDDYCDGSRDTGSRMDEVIFEEFKGTAI